ncbi:MAG: DNA-binding protein [Nitrospirae bacterium]|nr:DNA-binding protein [Nitrospirota bacterium]
MKYFLIYLNVLFLALFLMAGHGNTYSEHDQSCSRMGVSGAISGRVIEVLNSGGYTYVYIEKEDKRIWVAVPAMKIVKGKEMSFYPGSEVVDFQSKSMMLRFERIILSRGPIGMKGVPAINSVGTGFFTTEKIKVGKAPGFNAYIVEEIYRKRNILDGKDIMVRGKVVKVAPGIMNKNWIHIQDGSGSSKKGTNVLVVTSKDMPSIGDILTANGIVRRDKDFGEGYKYRVIVEDADLYPF